MRDHVIVVPSDRCIIVDGASLVFDFTAPEGLHALQWHKGTGHTEWRGEANRPLTKDAYAAEVAPFVVLWEGERTRLDAVAAARAEEAEIARLSPEHIAEAIRWARDRRLNEGGLIWRVYLVSVDKVATDRMTSTALSDGGAAAGALENVRRRVCRVGAGGFHGHGCRGRRSDPEVLRH